VIFLLENWVQLVRDAGAKAFAYGGIFIFTTFLGFSWQWIKRLFAFYRLRKAFGRCADKTDNLVMSMPLWSVKEAPRETMRFQRRSHRGKIEEFYGPTETVAYQDFIGAIEIADLFADYHSRPIRVIQDDERPDWVGKTGILLGSPLANYHAKAIYDYYRQQHFGDLLIEIFGIPENEETEARMAFKDCKTQIEYHASRDIEYAVIMRLNNYFGKKSRKGYIFIVCGIHAEGTLAAATYLRTHWQRFTSRKGPAAALIEMQRARPETYKEVLFRKR
jgi:hypothetical protein